MWRRLIRPARSLVARARAPTEWGQGKRCQAAGDVLRQNVGLFRWKTPLQERRHEDTKQSWILPEAFHWFAIPDIFSQGTAVAASASAAFAVHAPSRCDDKVGFQ